MGAAGSDIDQGGIGCLDIGTDLLGGSAIGHGVKFRDMGTDAAHEEGAGQIPPQIGPQDNGAATAEGAGQRLGLPPAGGCDGRGGFAGSGDLHIPPPEHSCAVYCD